MRGEKWRGVAWRLCDDGTALAGVQWRGGLAGYANTIPSRSGPAHSLIFGRSALDIRGNAPLNLYCSQNTVSNNQVLAHSCLNSSGMKSTRGTPIPARDFPFERRGLGVKKLEVAGTDACLTRDCLARSSLAVIRVPGIERPVARKELMTLEETDSQ